MTTTAGTHILIIAGPNGAGKTTFAMEFLPNEANCPILVNADLIATGLSPFRPRLAALRAGRLMLCEIHKHARRGDSFAFETTLAGRHYAPLDSSPAARRLSGHLAVFRPADTRVRSAPRQAAGLERRTRHTGADRFDAGWRNFTKSIGALSIDRCSTTTPARSHGSWLRRRDNGFQ